MTIKRYTSTTGTTLVSYYQVSDTRGLRRGGLTPGCGFVHARNGRGCRQIEAAKCDSSTAKGCRKEVTSCSKVPVRPTSGV